MDNTEDKPLIFFDLKLNRSYYSVGLQYVNDYKPVQYNGDPPWKSDKTLGGSRSKILNKKRLYQAQDPSFQFPAEVSMDKFKLIALWCQAKNLESLVEGTEGNLKEAGENLYVFAIYKEGRKITIHDSRVNLKILNAERIPLNEVTKTLRVLFPKTLQQPF